MSSLAPSKRERPTNTLPSRTGLAAWLKPYFAGTVGQKMVVAVTGILLVGFVIAHMLGNLQIFGGPDMINGYARKLKDLGPLLWTMRIGLLVVFVVHILVSLSLKKRSLDARPIGYQHPAIIQATFGSLTMPQTGLLILAFTVYHIAHFTLGLTQTANGTNFLALETATDPKLHDVYRMMIVGFTNPFVSITYLAAQIVLFIHVRHGVGSVFQTLGLNTPRTSKAVRWLALAVAGLVFLGNVAIVAAVWGGLVR